jgi:hypothetical protein
MKKITEYKTQIKNDDDLHRWKSTWDGHSDLPESVSNYVRKQVLPRILEDMENLLKLPNNNENI